MNSSLPSPVTAYFDAANAGNADAAAACFTPEARVHDESRDHVGRGSIRRWIEETSRSYQPEMQPLRAAPEGERLVVTARVSGAFPGSPIELDFAFTLAGDAIAALDIG